MVTSAPCAGFASEVTTRKFVDSPTFQVTLVVESSVDPTTPPPASSLNSTVSEPSGASGTAAVPC